MIQDMVRPATVMPSHVGEQATSGGTLRSGTWTDSFTSSVGSFARVVLPVSDVTLAFDSDGTLRRLLEMTACRAEALAEAGCTGGGTLHLHR